jgi:hypothetical protein
MADLGEYLGISGVFKDPAKLLEAITKAQAKAKK